VQLEQKKAEFASQGFNVAVISYDSAAVLKAFADRVGITYPLLSDPDSKIIRDFGILNETVPKGTPFYGVPYPGTYILDARGIVLKKFFETDYKERYTAGSMLFRAAPASARDGWSEIETRHLTLRYRAADSTIQGGMTTTLAIEIALKPKMHVYAPSVTGGYIPVRWTIDPQPAFKPLDPEWPPAKTLYLPAIQETLPVFEKTFTVTRDLAFAQQNELFAAAGDSKRLAVSATFRYQACDDKECHPPVNVPLSWTFTVEPLDRTRVPEPLRRK
jgi:hypothetical protein